MAFLTLGPNLLTGHATLDNQHRGLVEAVNRLFEALQEGRDREELGHTLAFLRNYTADHFRLEERFMDQSGYRGATRHKATHADLMRKVIELENRFKAGDGTPGLEVAHFLKAWIAQHIGVEDVALGAALRARGNPSNCHTDQC